MNSQKNDSLIQHSSSLLSDSNLQQSTLPSSSQSISEDSTNTTDIIQLTLQKSDNGSLGLILNEEVSYNPNTSKSTPHLYT